MADKPILVQAIHSYAPKNNDELKLEKGDILTIARKEDGGWWEGTLANGKTGWFPSNYVEDVLPSSPLATAVASNPVQSPTSATNGQLKKSPSKTTSTPTTEGSPQTTQMQASFAAQQAEYRQVALTELIESESTHLSELQVFWDNYLIPLQKSDLLSPTEFKTLIGNLPEVVQTQRNCILLPLQTENIKNQKEQRIGSLFLENAPKLESVHKLYCNNHPKAVQIVERHKEELSSFFENKGCPKKPGILYLITSLSGSFRRLEKYPLMLQEVERHVEEFHKDRGDLQRSIEYYKEIQKTCGALRKQKEMELEVLSGAIKGWEGAEVSQLGEIIFMNLVYLGFERVARYLVLFTNTLLILSYNTENNSLVYEGKVPVSGITLKPLQEKDGLTNAFEIAGPMIDQIIVNCSSKSVRETWMGYLSSILKTNRFPSFSSSPQQSFGELVPPVQAWNISRLRPATPFNPFLFEYLKKLKHESSGSSLGGHNPNSKNGGNRSGERNSATASIVSIGNSYNNNNSQSLVTNEEDFAVLSIVDSFCNKNRLTVPSSASLIIGDSPGKNNSANPHPHPPRTLAQVVMELRDEVLSLRKSMEDEQGKRMALQVLVQKRLSSSGQIGVGGTTSPVLSASTPPEH